MAGVISMIMSTIATLETNYTTIVNLLDLIEGNQNALAEFKATLPVIREDVNSLKAKLDDYKELFCKIRIPPDNAISPIFRKAALMLKRIEKRLMDLKRDSESCGCDRCGCVSTIRWLWSKLIMICRPREAEDRVGEMIKKVNDELDKISKILKDRQETSAVILKFGKSQPNPKVVYNNDRLYVPLVKFETEVIEAIEDFSGHPIIFLYGGTGKGKSTLARRMWERYGKYGEKANVFDNVNFQVCSGLSAKDLSTKQSEILQNLDPENDSKDPSSDLGKLLLGDKRSLIIFDDVWDENFLHGMWKIGKGIKYVKYLITSQRSSLCGNLREDSLHIGMGDPNLNEAKKILASLVGLTRISNDGLPEPFIPDHLQVIAEKFIKITEGNLLALACLAGNIPDFYKKDKRTWHEVYDSLNQRLNVPQTKIVLGQIDGTSKSFWTALGLSIDSSTNDAKVILDLIYACKRGSVPGEVVRILHSEVFRKLHIDKLENTSSIEWSPKQVSSNKTTKEKDAKTVSESSERSSSNETTKERVAKTVNESSDKSSNNRALSNTFTRSIDELFTKGLLKKTVQGENSLEVTSWSLGALVKPYMDMHMPNNEEFNFFITTLLHQKSSTGKNDAMFIKKGQLSEYNQKPIKSSTVGTGMGAVDSEKTKVVTALCALYFDEVHRAEVVTKVANQARDACKLDSFNQAFVNILNPLIWLLDQPEEDDGQWTELDVHRTRQIFLKYVCEGQLHDHNISILLKLADYTSAQFNILETIHRICLFEDKPMLTASKLSFLKPLVLLLKSEDRSMQVAALKTLSSISWKAAKENATTAKLKIAEQEGALPVLAEWLSHVDKLAAKVTELKNADPEGALGPLVESSTYIGELKAAAKEQYIAVLTLVNLVYRADDDFKWKIVNAKGMLAGLVKLLTNSSYPGLSDNAETKYFISLAYQAAATTFVSLALVEKEELRLKFLTEAGALPGLVKLLGHEGYLQEQAAGALASLACGGDRIKVEKLEQEKALSGLVKVLSAQKKLSLQKTAPALMSLLKTLIDDYLATTSN